MVTSNKGIMCMFLTLASNENACNFYNYQPTRTCEEAKAYEYRESETCNCNVENEEKNPKPKGGLIPRNMQSRNAL